MKLRWTPEALAQLDAARDYIQSDNPKAAKKVITSIREVAKILTSHPRAGRPGRVDGTRELVISGTSYIVVYAILKETVAILTILHGAQRYS